MLAIICALFAHNIQPKLRSLRENGFSSLLPSREVAYTSAAFSLIGTLILLGVVVDGPGTDEDTPTMRVGPGDVNLDVVEVHSLWHPAEVGIRNVGDEDVEVLIIHRDAVERHAQDGVIDWASLSDGDVRLLEPGDSLDEQIETPSVYDGHFVLVTNQGDSGVGEVRVTIEYVDGSLLWSAIISSIPSFAITGLVIGWMYFSEDEVSEKIPNE